MQKIFVGLCYYFIKDLLNLQKIDVEPFRRNNTIMLKKYLILYILFYFNLITPYLLFAQEETEKPMIVGTAVDLGLSVKWADRNIGADKPEKYGYYYAWGETKPKNVYTWNTYRLSAGQDLYKKYSLDKEHCAKGFECDNKHRLDAADDAATANWGAPWRMPTMNEIKELFMNCEWKKERCKGVEGYKVTGPNGNSIFLPFAGYCLGFDPQEVKKSCTIPSSTLIKSDKTASQIRTIGEGSFYNPVSLRHVGVTVRAVCKK